MKRIAMVMMFRMRWPHPKEGKMRKILLLIGVLWTGAEALHAEGSLYTAREFVQMCEQVDREDNNTLEANHSGYCLGYFWAVIRWNETGRTRSSLCVPQRVTVDELRKVFLKYMNDYPEKLHEDADLMVWEALMGPFACKD